MEIALTATDSTLGSDGTLEAFLHDVNEFCKGLHSDAFEVGEVRGNILSLLA